MAENKKSFLLYCDLIHTIEKLPDDKAGLLFKHILQYVNDQYPETDDLLVEIAFEPIKQQLKRDLIVWEDFRKKQAENGKLGGRPKNPSQAKKPEQNPSLVSETQKSLNVNATDNVNVTSVKRIHTHEFFDFCEKNGIWFSQSDHYSLGPEKMKIKAKEFQQLQVSSEKVWADEKDMKSHFTHWLKNNYNKQSSGSQVTAKSGNSKNFDEA